MRKSPVTTIIGVLLLVAGCDGEIGPAGPQGSPGNDGTPCWEGLADQNGDDVVDVLDCRLAGVDGLACWDLNGNGVADLPLEDFNADGTVDVRDCRGLPGFDGQACWDLDGNGEGDVATEDNNGDGLVDVRDCVGPAGEDAEGFGPAVYVGASACEACHPDHAYRVARHGHGNALRSTEGLPPTAMHTTLGISSIPTNGNHPADPPGGFSWADITYLVGGWSKMVRFFDSEGYLITCDAGDTDSDGDGFCDAECAGSTPGTCDSGTFANQWNQASDTFVAYHPGEAASPFNCGPCHTTGFDPNAVTVDAGGQPLPGIEGGWNEIGVQCEACHGPGSRHVADPLHEQIFIDRDPELCGGCHAHSDPRQIPAEAVADEGFIPHTNQWNEIFASKKHVMDCIDCHDPHQSALWQDTSTLPDSSEPVNFDKGIRTTCETCHFEQDAQQSNIGRTGDSPMKILVSCAQCHMPRMTLAAEGNLADYTGDVRTHLFAINTDVTAPQFTADGEHAMPWVTLKWACRSCHPPDEPSRGGRLFSARSDAELETLADGYHD